MHRKRFIIGNSKNGRLNCNNILFKGSKITWLNICGKYILELENIQSMYRRIDFDVNSETHGNQFKLMPLLMRLTCFMRFPRFCRIYSCSPPDGVFDWPLRLSLKIKTILLRGRLFLSSRNFISKFHTTDGRRHSRGGNLITPDYLREWQDLSRTVEIILEKIRQNPARFHR